MIRSPHTAWLVADAQSFDLIFFSPIFIKTLLLWQSFSAGVKSGVNENNIFTQGMTSITTGDMKCFFFFVCLFYFSIFYFLFLWLLLLLVLNDCRTLKVCESEETAKVGVRCNGLYVVTEVGGYTVSHMDAHSECLDKSQVVVRVKRHMWMDRN